jgi:hypothetical protein
MSDDEGSGAGAVTQPQPQPLQPPRQQQQPPQPQARTHLAAGVFHCHYHKCLHKVVEPKCKDRFPRTLTS